MTWNSRAAVAIARYLAWATCFTNCCSCSRGRGSRRNVSTSAQPIQFLDTQPSLFQDGVKRSFGYGPPKVDGDCERLAVALAVEREMAPFLAPAHKPGLLQGSYEFLGCEDRKFGHVRESR